MPPSTLEISIPHAANTFLILKENRFAYAAVQEFDRPRTKLSKRLVYISGPSGAGKTHLVQQFYRDQIQKHPDRKVVHVTAGKFAAELAEASEAKTIDQFSIRYRELDLLICEDLSELEKRPQSQIQLTHIIDEILNSGGRILFTCNKMPGELANTLPRLVNRCHSGVCTSMQYPDMESRVSIIRNFSETRQIPLPAEVTELLGKTLCGSPRELLATIVQLEMHARFEKTDITLSFARKFLDGEIQKKQLTLTQISRAVAGYFEMTVKELRSPDRRKGNIFPRQCGMFIARKVTQNSLQRIAEYFGRTHYSTVIHACKGVKKQIADDAALRQSVSDIYRKLNISIPPEGE